MTPQYFSAAMNFPLASKLIVNYLLDIFTLIPNRYLRSKLSVLDPGPWRRFWDRSLTDTPPHCQWSPIFFTPMTAGLPFSHSPYWHFCTCLPPSQLLFKIQFKHYLLKNLSELPAPSPPSQAEFLSSNLWYDTALIPLLTLWLETAFIKLSTWCLAQSIAKNSICATQNSALPNLW